jgi:nucleoside 2-deoxyribosyltransferase
MRIYLAGPMTGLPDFNFPAFHECAEALRASGHTVKNPAETDGGDTSQPWSYYMRKDIAMLLECEAVAVLPGWERSRGATLEVHVARALGMPVLDAHTLEPYGETILQEAQRLVHGDRGTAYGHPFHDYARTGRMWGAILGIPDIDPRICCLMMAAVKISRETNASKRDNRADLAGYAECADMVAQEQARRAREAA